MPISSLPATLRDVHRFRGFILGSVKRDFTARYQASMLGAFWLILQPLAQILVYTLIFANVMRSRLPGVESAYGYSIFLCAGILPWALFAEIVSKSQTMFLDHANLLKKLTFPRICLPIIVALNGLANFAIIFSLFVLFLLLSGNFPGPAFAALLPVLVIQLLFSVGLGLIIGVLNVFFRDVGQLFQILLQFWFWLTPVIYSMAILPDWAHRAISLNPMTPLILAYQTILLRGDWPDWDSLWPVLILALLLCALGLAFFRRRAGEMVDEL